MKMKSIHPLHPLAVQLPIGLWVASFIFDLLYLQNHSPNLAASYYYCILVGLISSLIALPTGLAEYLAIPLGTRAKRVAAMHFALNLVVIALYVIGFFARRGENQTVPQVVLPGSILLSVASLMLLSVSAYLGGILIYDLGVGLRSPSEAGPKTAIRPKNKNDSPPSRAA